MWTVAVEFIQPNPQQPEPGLEPGAVMVETQAEAEEWWTCRTRTRCNVRRVHTMIDPTGNVVRVKRD
jgi:hypothetical protein